MTEPLIHLKDLTKGFGGPPVLKSLNLEVFEGEITVVIGKSGEGKSVLLKHIVGLLMPDDGQVLIKGKDIWSLGRVERMELLSKFSYLFQGTALFDSMTVLENVSLPLIEKRIMRPKPALEQAHKVMRLLDLPEVDHKYPSQLSGGMQKRVALARALVTQPQVLLFDEPTTGLDPVRKMAVLNMVADYHHKLGFTGVLVSHAIPEILYICQRVAFLSGGKIVFQGGPADLVKVSDPEIQAFFAGVDQQCADPVWRERSPVQDPQVREALAHTLAQTGEGNPA